MRKGTAEINWHTAFLNWRTLWKLQEVYYNLKELKALLTSAAWLCYFPLKNPAFFQGRKKSPNLDLFYAPVVFWSLQSPGEILQGKQMTESWTD